VVKTVENDPDFLKTINTGYEHWVYGYDPETKAQSSQWKTSAFPRPKKAMQVRSKMKVELTIFSTVQELCTMNMQVNL